MKITFQPQGKFTRIDDGLYVDEKGNHYHEERVLRYKVLRQRTDETQVNKNTDFLSLFLELLSANPINIAAAGVAGNQ